MVLGQWVPGAAGSFWVLFFVSAAASCSLAAVDSCAGSGCSIVAGPSVFGKMQCANFQFGKLTAHFNGLVFLGGGIDLLFSGLARNSHPCLIQVDVGRGQRDDEDGVGKLIEMPPVDMIEMPLAEGNAAR